MIPTMQRMSAQSVRRQIEAVLSAWGMSEDIVRTTADVMAETDLIGVDSHGISMLFTYDRMRAAGKLNLKAEPRVVRENAVTALMDGGAGLGHAAAVKGMTLAIDKALANGVGVVSVRNSHHFGAAGYYAAMAARRGVIGMVTSSTRYVAVVPTHGAEPVLGTNPIALAAPAGHNPAPVLDIATSVVAINKVKVYAYKEHELPAGWVIDGEGRSVTNAAEALAVLQQQPDGGINPFGGTREMGGHKGYGLSMFAHILAASLSGSAFAPMRDPNRPASAPEDIGHFFLAVNPASFREPEAFAADVDTVVDTLRASRPADPAKPVLVPGDPEITTREERLRHGIPMTPMLLEQIRAVTEGCGAPYLLEPVEAGAPA